MGSILAPRSSLVVQHEQDSDDIGSDEADVDEDDTDDEEEETERPPPEGFKPIGKCTYVRYILFYVSPANATIQTVGFFNRGHWKYGILNAIVLIFMLFAEGRHWYNRGSPVKEAKLSVARGLETSPWIVVRRMRVLMESVYLGMIATYGNAFSTKLSLVTGVSAAIGLLLWCGAIAKFALHQTDLGAFPPVGYSYAAEVVLQSHRPRLFNFLQLYRKVQAWNNIAHFAIASAVLHPAVVLFSYLGNLICVTIGMEKGWFRHVDVHWKYVFQEAAVLILMPWSFITWPWSSPSGIWVRTMHKGQDVRPLPGRWFVRIYAFRLILISAMCFTIKLPHGVAPIGTLGRPMGKNVLQNDFISPAAATWSAAVACCGGLEKCAAPNLEGLSISSVLYRSLLVLVVVISLPMDLLCSVYLLCCNKEICDAVEDHQLIETCLAKKKEIDDWVYERTGEPAFIAEQEHRLRKEWSAIGM